MASNAIVGDPVMIKCTGKPTRSDMAIVTGVWARDMVRSLTDDRVIVVAADTFAHDLLMIHVYHRIPVECVMATFAIIRGRNMGI